MKRSRCVRLVLMGVAAGGLLTGCADDVEAPLVEEARLFATQEECAATEGYTADICQAFFAEATSQHLDSAPRFPSLAACEQQFGDCQPGSGNVWMPALAGFVVGQTVGSLLSPSRTYPQPLYRPAKSSVDDCAYNPNSVACQNSRSTSSSSSYRTLHSGSRLTPARGKVTLDQASRQSSYRQTGGASTSRGGFGSSARASGSSS